MILFSVCPYLNAFLLGSFFYMKKRNMHRSVSVLLVFTWKKFVMVMFYDLFALFLCILFDGYYEGCGVRYFWFFFFYIYSAGDQS